MSMTVGTLRVLLELDDSHFNRGLDQAESKMGRMGSRMGSIGGKIGKVAFTGAALGVTALGAGLAAGVVAGIKFNSSIEQTTIAMGTMLGSTAQAKTLIGEVTKMAAATPFEFPELADATKRLVAYGVAAEDAVPLMTRLGDISSALQIPIGELSDIYGKMKVSGRITMEDINQLAGRGIPIYSALGKVMGVPEAKIRDMVSAGKIGFPMIEQAFENITDKGSMFGGMMDKQSTSFAGLMSTLKDSTIQVFATAVKPLFGWLVDKALPKAIELVGKFQAGFSKGGIEGGLRAIFPEGMANDLISTFAIIKDTVVGIVKVLGKIGSTFIGLPSEVKKFAIAVAALPLALKGFSMLSSGKSIFENLFGKGGPAAANVPLQSALGLNTAATEANTLALGGRGVLPGGPTPVAPVLTAAEGGTAALAPLSKLARFGKFASRLAVPLAVLDAFIRAPAEAEVKAKLGPMSFWEDFEYYSKHMADGVSGGLTVGLTRGVDQFKQNAAAKMPFWQNATGTVMDSLTKTFKVATGFDMPNWFGGAKEAVKTGGASIAQSLRASGDKAGANLAAGLRSGVGPALQAIQKVHDAAGKPIRTGRLDTSGWTGPMFAAMQRAMEFREMVGRGTTTGGSRRPAPPPPPVWHAPGRSAGGNVSGPSSGYPVIMHGEETVVAHNNPSRGLADLAAAGIGGGGDVHIHIANVNGTDRAAARKFADMVGGILMQQVRYGT